MKKSALCILVVFVVLLCGCQTGEKKLGAKPDNGLLEEAIMTAEFDVPGAYEDLTFGGVMDRLVECYPEKCSYSFLFDTEISGYEDISGRFLSGYDYVSCLMQWELRSDEGGTTYTETLFSVNRDTWEVTPVAIAYDFGEWDFREDSNPGLIIEEVYLIVSLVEVSEEKIPDSLFFMSHMDPQKNADGTYSFVGRVTDGRTNQYSLSITLEVTAVNGRTLTMGDSAVIAAKTYVREDGTYGSVLSDALYDRYALLQVYFEFVYDINGNLIKMVQVN